MKFDVFFSICQTEVDGYMPSEKTMFENFFEQIELADELGYEVGWVAETHLSCQVQKENEKPVIPLFKGEIGLNTDILQVAHKVFARTKNIHIGSAIRNILCNGGPLAHAESVRTFLALHGLDPAEKRKLHLGFAAGRFPFSNSPYGIVPRSQTEEVAWPVVKGKIFHEATEIFLRALRGEKFSSRDIATRKMVRSDFRTDDEWQRAFKVYKDEFKLSGDGDVILLPGRWSFEKVGLIPQDVSLDNLELTIGSHDPAVQALANQFLPCGVFNLSITPGSEIEQTHARMKSEYHSAGGQWRRELMPRTVLVYLNNDPNLSIEERRKKAEGDARRAHENYWRAMEGTIDSGKVEKATQNTLWGDPEMVLKKLKEKYNAEDRLMLWFDFNNHDNVAVKKNMRLFAEHVRPELING
ncbi:MAG: LLM class flavin-dependent oxidoreductase [Bdellovibrionales bacterium]|nr:LLM class flavin-dependent oxidoreductase [Bdellovibrionales bacterium]